jgi:hypothetical protein
LVEIGRRHRGGRRHGRRMCRDCRGGSGRLRVGTRAQRRVQRFHGGRRGSFLSGRGYGSPDRVRISRRCPGVVRLPHRGLLGARRGENRRLRAGVGRAFRLAGGARCSFRAQLLRFQGGRPAGSGVSDLDRQRAGVAVSRSSPARAPRAQSRIRGHGRRRRAGTQQTRRACGGNRRRGCFRHQGRWTGGRRRESGRGRARAPARRSAVLPRIARRRACRRRVQPKRADDGAVRSPFPRNQHHERRIRRWHGDRAGHGGRRRHGAYGRLSVDVAHLSARAAGEGHIGQPRRKTFRGRG